ncbi:hypothetical protein DM450_08015 [Sphingomonas sp. IC081]|nr:hypothetical protein DM450_08015 [Sphingomonas sp. IC081]
MLDNAVHPAGVEDAEAVMRAELARGDALAGNVQPVLRHLLSAHDAPLFSDEVLARVRGMFADLARNLLTAADEASPGAGVRDPGVTEHELLVRALMDRRELLLHVHALAIEWLLTDRLQARAALDPVVSPLVQSLVSGDDEAAQALAMTWLAAQARWSQAQRRMGLPFTELPGELLHGARLALRSVLAGSAQRANAAEAAIRARYDEGSGRLGLGARLIMGLGRDAGVALALDRAGLGLFLTALSLASGQPRDVLALSTHEPQIARFVLALRAAGLTAEDVSRQMLTLQPGIVLPGGLAQIGSDLAGAILATGRYGG